MCVYFVSFAGLCVIGCLFCSFFWCKSCRCHYKKICPLRKGSQALLESSSSSSLDHLSTLSSSSASSSGSSQWDIFTFNELIRCFHQISWSFVRRQILVVKKYVKNVSKNASEILGNHNKHLCVFFVFKTKSILNFENELFF